MFCGRQRAAAAPREGCATRCAAKATAHLTRAPVSAWAPAVTVDHATVAPEEDGAKDAVSFPFDCSCGAVECRETVTADDWSAPAWQRRYAGRMRSAVSVKVQRWWSARFPAAIPATYDSTLVRRHGIAAHWRADLGRYIVNNRPIKAGEDVLVLYTRHTRPTIAQAREMGENRCLQIAADAYQASLSVEDLCNLLSHACDPTCRVVIEYETVPLHPGGRTELPVTLCFAELSDEAVAALPEHECGALRGAVAATDTDAGATSSHEVEVLLDAAASVASSHAGSASSPEDPEARDDGAVRLEVIRMVARRDLPVGSVLSFDYRVTDAEIGEAESFDCVCGAPTCAGSVRGFSSLPRALMQQLVREHGPAWHAAMLDDGDAREAGSR